MDAVRAEVDAGQVLVGGYSRALHHRSRRSRPPRPMDDLGRVERPDELVADGEPRDRLACVCRPWVDSGPRVSRTARVSRRPHPARLDVLGHGPSERVVMRYVRGMSKVTLLLSVAIAFAGCKKASDLAKY